MLQLMHDFEKNNNLKKKNPLRSLYGNLIIPYMNGKFREFVFGNK